MDIKIKKLNENAVIPFYASKNAVGMDLTATSKKWDDNSQVWDYGFGLAMEIPEGYGGFIFPRSSVYKSGLSLSNCVGVIDPDYRGEISAKFREVNWKNENSRYEVGDRIAQIIFIETTKVNFVEVDELSNTERGEGGHGSTGR
ncbi:MAG: dUTP diphosphatase [Prevotella sp.]|nr:dUTP diphosphatase [Prevotella sp.]